MVIFGSEKKSASRNVWETPLYILVLVTSAWRTLQFQNTVPIFGEVKKDIHPAWGMDVACAEPGP
jgi:hypothetical protein